jgi:ribosome-associated protein
MLSISDHIQIPLDEFEFTYARSGGPGGQNVNKVNSKAMLRWPIATSPSVPEPVRARFMEKYASRVTLDGDVILTSQKHRDQASNVEDCLEKLKEMLVAVATPQTPRRPTRPSRASVERRTEAKRENAIKKQQRRRPDTDY